MTSSELPKVSVVVTTYNGADYIARQLHSIAAQTYLPFEIIISDDGSTDGTLQELELLSKTISFRLYVRSAPLGINANLAFALQKCSGDLIAIADQDDIWDLEKIHVLVNALGDEDAIFSNSSIIDEHDQLLGGSLMERLLDGAKPCIDKSPLRLMFKNVVSGHALLFRRKLLEAVIPFVHEYMYDQQIAIAATLGGGIVYLDRTLVLHRQHMNNSCNKFISQEGESKSVQVDRSKRLSRKSRTLRVAGQLRTFIHYALNVSARMSSETAAVRNVRRFARLLDGSSFSARCALFIHVLRNRAELFPYYPHSRQLKLAWRLGRVFVSPPPEQG